MSEVLTTVSPISNKPILTRDGLAASDVALLPAIATQAYNSYRLTPLEHRQAIVGRALQLIIEKQEVLAKELTEQMGRPIAYVSKEITTAVARGEYLLKISSGALGDTAGEPEQGFRRYIKKLPVGPVMILFAWNVGHDSNAASILLKCAEPPFQYPYLILVNSLIPALLAGNSVILKPSPRT